jgi:nitric oxide reductase large subunit
MYSSSPSKIGVSSSLGESIRAREPLPLIMMEQDQVKGKTVQRGKDEENYLDLPWMIGLDE